MVPVSELGAVYSRQTSRCAANVQLGTRDAARVLALAVVCWSGNRAVLNAPVGPSRRATISTGSAIAVSFGPGWRKIDVDFKSLNGDGGDAAPHLFSGRRLVGRSKSSLAEAVDHSIDDGRILVSQCSFVCLQRELWA